MEFPKIPTKVETRKKWAEVIGDFDPDKHEYYDNLNEVYIGDPLTWDHPLEYNNPFIYSIHPKRTDFDVDQFYKDNVDATFEEKLFEIALMFKEKKCKKLKFCFSSMEKVNQVIENAKNTGCYIGHKLYSRKLIENYST